MNVAISATYASRVLLPTRQLTAFCGLSNVSGMATRRKTSKKKAPSKKERAISSPPRKFCLGAWMAHLQVSTEELAERMRTDRTTVWRWETGERQPRKGTIPRIADALGIEPADLWRQPGLIDLNAAAAHITDNTARKKLADFIRDYPAS